MSPNPSLIAVLLALGSAAALAQEPAAPTPVPPKPAGSPTYGPVLHPQVPPVTTRQPTPATTQAAGEARPQAQEERAGQPPGKGVRDEVDPSARPAPAPVQPRTKDQPQMQDKQDKHDKQDKQARRRPGAVQRIDSTPRIVVPVPVPPAQVQAQVQPAPPAVGPSSTQVMGCMGSTCTDAAGTTYNAGGPGNATVRSDGRLCTRNGVTIQCL